MTWPWIGWFMKGSAWLWAKHSLCSRLRVWPHCGSRVSWHYEVNYLLLDTKWYQEKVIYLLQVTHPQRIKHSPRWANSFSPYYYEMPSWHCVLFALAHQRAGFHHSFLCFFPFSALNSEGKDSVAKWKVLFPLEIKGHNSMEWYWVASSSDLCPWNTDGIYTKRWKISKSEVEEQGTNMFNQADLQPHRSSLKINILNGISYNCLLQLFYNALQH